MPIYEDISKEKFRDPNDKSVVWDGIFAHDIIKNHILNWLGDKYLAAAIKLEKEDFISVLQYGGKKHVTSADGITVALDSAGFSIRFDKPTAYEEINDSNISELSIEWNCAAAFIGNWLYEKYVQPFK